MSCRSSKDAWRIEDATGKAICYCAPSVVEQLVKCYKGKDWYFVENTVVVHRGFR